jgi:hypothetical protein
MDEALPRLETQGEYLPATVLAASHAAGGSPQGLL